MNSSFLFTVSGSHKRTYRGGCLHWCQDKCMEYWHGVERGERERLWEDNAIVMPPRVYVCVCAYVRVTDWYNCCINVSQKETIIELILSIRYAIIAVRSGYWWSVFASPLWIRIRIIYLVIFQTQETSAKTMELSGRCRRSHLEKCSSVCSSCMAFLVPQFIANEED